MPESVKLRRTRALDTSSVITNPPRKSSSTASLSNNLLQMDAGDGEMYLLPREKAEFRMGRCGNISSHAIIRNQLLSFYACNDYHAIVSILRSIYNHFLHPLHPVFIHSSPISPIPSFSPSSIFIQHLINIQPQFPSHNFL